MYHGGGVCTVLVTSEMHSPVSKGVFSLRNHYILDDIVQH